MSVEAQIGCYLLPHEAKALTRYARMLELSRPKLCALLVIRAAHSGQLASMVGRFPASEPKAGNSRVTTRLSNQDTKQNFLEAASAVGLGSDDAAAIIFRAELDEHWLEKSLAEPRNRP